MAYGVVLSDCSNTLPSKHFEHHYFGLASDISNFMSHVFEIFTTEELTAINKYQMISYYCNNKYV